MTKGSIQSHARPPSNQPRRPETDLETLLTPTRPPCETSMTPAAGTTSRNRNQRDTLAKPNMSACPPPILTANPVDAKPRDQRSGRPTDQPRNLSTYASMLFFQFEKGASQFGISQRLSQILASAMKLHSKLSEKMG